MSDYIDKLQLVGTMANEPVKRGGTRVVLNRSGMLAGPLSLASFQDEADAEFYVVSRNCWSELVAVVRAAGARFDNPEEPEHVWRRNMLDALAALAAKVGGG